MRHDPRLLDPFGRILSGGLFAEVRELHASLPADKELELSASLSGREPNQLFYNLEGRQFADLSGISGIDEVADARVVAVWDYDRDGWSDLAVANADAPLLQIFHNGIGEPDGRRHHFVALRLIGGNQRSRPDPEWSARDGYGARVVLTVGGRKRVVEHRCGEGFAAQNSSTLVLGIGDASAVGQLEVFWPSGRRQEINGLPAGKLVTVYEKPEQAPNGGFYEVSTYRRPP